MRHMAHPACCAVSLSESGLFGGATARQRGLPGAELLSLSLHTRKRSARAAQTSTRGDNQVTCVYDGASPSLHANARGLALSTGKLGCSPQVPIYHTCRLGSPELPMRGVTFDDVVVHPACRSAGYPPRWNGPLSFETTFARLPPSVATDGYVRPLVESREE